MDSVSLTLQVAIATTRVASLLHKGHFQLDIVIIKSHLLALLRILMLVLHPNYLQAITHPCLLLHHNDGRTYRLMPDGLLQSQLQMLHL